MKIENKLILTIPDYDLECIGKFISCLIDDVLEGNLSCKERNLSNINWEVRRIAVNAFELGLQHNVEEPAEPITGSVRKNNKGLN